MKYETLHFTLYYVSVEILDVMKKHGDFQVIDNSKEMLTMSLLLANAAYLPKQPCISTTSMR